ncbi:hypothetical protein [Bradyrhizobium sp. 27S5]|uniref:hypothetical protein n=1 Tax=Bradyrhizobium sp. 27S5 TaxID=3139728 RepID=UPI0030CBB15F
MDSDQRDSIVVPDDELTRQATDAIAGFGYQLYQTVSAWMSLKDGEQLFVEMAEDFAINSRTALSMTQVKRTRASVTLRSRGVVALITALWTFQEANPGKTVSSAFLTTSGIGKEKGLSFPNSVAGLTYWRIGAREQADVEPLRTALISLDLPAGLKAFLETATPDDIRNRILRPIHWYTAAPSADELERDLEDRLVLYGQHRGVGAQDSRNALSALVVELLRCVRRPATDRYVTAADMATVFERNTFRLVPPSLLRTGLPIPGATEVLTPSGLNVSDAASIPLPPRAALRSDIVGERHGALVADGVLWLQGSSGVGKTTLALLIARRQNAPWLFADLRDLEANALRMALTRLATTFAANVGRGLILDDLPPDIDNATILALRRVARAVSDVDGLLIVTSTKPPAPTVRSSIGVRPGSVKAVPHLTESDIAEIVTHAGGDASSWSRLILVSTGGHPQLVDARIMGLRQRGWRDDRLADILPRSGRRSDVEMERQAVRVRLLQEMDEGSREMLFRLSLLTSNFDRAMAIAAASATPQLAQAGLVFDALIGPWIEHAGPERFRISQLLRDSGEAALGHPLKQVVRGAVLRHLLDERPFPADQLMQVFILAFGLRHVQGLGLFSAMLISNAYRNKELFSRLAEEVSIFVLAGSDAGKPLFPENLHISCMLRYAQLLVACSLNDFAAAGKVLDIALAEAANLDPEFKTHMHSMLLCSALIERGLSLPPLRWLGMLHALSEIPGGLLRKRSPQQNPLTGLVMTTSHEEELFVLRATALTSLDELAQLIDAMDQLPVQRRDQYLSAATSMLQSTAHIVASAWLADVERPDFDAKTAAEMLARLRVKVRSWSSRDIAVELACAHAVILDEYAHDEQAALSVLADAQAEYPDDYRVNRQRQKVYYRNGQHERALAEFEIFARSLDRASLIDSAFALREAGRSAAEIGELKRTRTFFERAWQALASSFDHMLPMKAGLSGDCAILTYQTGDVDEAIMLMIRALGEAERIDPSKGLKEHYCVLVLLTAILWMRGARADWPLVRQAMVIGMCSNPDPPPELQARPLPQRQLVWYELAELEADVSNSTVALVELRKRTKNGNGLLPMEVSLAGSVLRAATRGLNIEGFLDAVRNYASAANYVGRLLRDRKPEDILNMPSGVVRPIAGKQWQEIAVQDAVRTATVVFVLSMASQGRRDLYDAFQALCRRTDGMSVVAASLFEFIDSPRTSAGDLVEATTEVVSQMLNPNFVFTATEAFGATVVIVQILAGHTLGEIVAKPVLGYFRILWREIIAERTFSMRNPSATAAFVLAAFDKGTTELAKLANVVLASEHAVRGRLSDELRAIVHRIAEPVREPVDYVNQGAAQR